MSKARSDAKLKTLSDEEQDLVVEWLRTKKTAECPGGIRHAREQCKAVLNLDVSNRALSEFLVWWELQQSFSEADIAGQVAEEQMRAFDPTNADKAVAFGHFVFTRQAIAKGDPGTFVAMERLKLDKESAVFKGALERERLDLDRDKHEVQTCERFLKWYGVKKARSIAESDLSNADKIAKLRQTFFADVDEAAAAGKVVLPPR